MDRITIKFWINRDKILDKWTWTSLIGLEALKKGQMAVWVAGDVEAYKKSKNVLDASYTTVLYTGKLGTAMIPKVLSNMLCAVQVLAMSECFAIGKYTNKNTSCTYNSPYTHRFNRS